MNDQNKLVQQNCNKETYACFSFQMFPYFVGQFVFKYALLMRLAT